MRKKFMTTRLGITIVVSVSAHTYAGEPMSVDFGGMSLTPALKITEAYDDNIRETSVNEISSWVTTIEPSVTLLAQDRNNYYQLKYSANSQLFHSERDIDNTDHDLSAMTHMKFSARNRLDLQAGYNKTEDVRDTTNLTENDKYHTYNIGGVYGLGSEAAVIHFDLGANQEWRRYDNSGALNQDRERDTQSLSAIAYYRVAPKTKALIELRHHDYDYVLSTSQLNSRSMVYLTGLIWEATAQTTGTAKFGYEKKDFDSSAIDSHSNGVWEVGIDWQPLTYSTFSLSARRGTDEGSVTEDFIEATNTSLNWNHQWRYNLSSDGYYSYTEEDYSNVNQRTDKTSDIGFNVNYDIRRWLTLGVGYTYRDRDSNVSVRGFEHSIFMFSGTISL